MMFSRGWRLNCYWCDRIIFLALPGESALLSLLFFDVRQADKLQRRVSALLRRNVRGHSVLYSSSRYDIRSCCTLQVSLSGTMPV